MSLKSWILKTNLTTFFLLYCEVVINQQWLTFVELLEPLIAFLEERKRFYPQLEDEEWMDAGSDVFTDVHHVQPLNAATQGKDEIISYSTLTFSAL